MNRIQVPTADAWPWYVATGPDGSVWFTEYQGNKVGRLGRDGSIMEVSLPLPLSLPKRIVVARDGTAWFAESNGFSIGRITPAGELTEFRASMHPEAVCTSSGGDVYFTMFWFNRIGRISRDGQITEFALPDKNSYGPVACAGDGDGNIWYATYSGMGYLSPSGAVTRFQLPYHQRSAWISAITFGHDGNIWLTDTGGLVRRVTPSGEVTDFEIDGIPNDIAVGPDGLLWFTRMFIPEGPPLKWGEVTSGSVVRMDYSGRMKEYPVTGNPVGIAGGSDGVWVAVMPDSILHISTSASPRRRAIRR